jgi:hypothetical protein
MPDGGVPADVQAFLREHVESYEQLEVLLRLRLQPDRSWTPLDVASELRISDELGLAALRFLCRERLLGVDVGRGVLLFRYAPQSAELVELIPRLAIAYEENRLEVMRLMTANAIDRLRLGPMNRLANAFLLGRKKNRDG